MKKRARYILAAVFALTISGIVVVAMLPQRGVAKANFDRIEKGMTRADVEAIFARRPHPADRPDRQRWFAEDGWTCAIIDFENDLVRKAQWFDDPRTATERFQMRIRWPWW